MFINTGKQKFTKVGNRLRVSAKIININYVTTVHVMGIICDKVMMRSIQQQRTGYNEPLDFFALDIKTLLKEYFLQFDFCRRSHIICSML